MEFKYIIQICLAALVIIFSEGSTLTLVFRQTLPLFWAIIIHLLIVAALALWTYFNHTAKNDLRMVALLFITTAFFGPFGAAGTLAIMAFFIFYKRSSLSFDEWYNELFPEESKYNIELQKFIESHERKSDFYRRVIPFGEVFSFGSLQQKRDAITMISKNFHPSFAGALHLSLKDSNNAIRVQAATAITQIENGFLTRALELKKAADKQTDDPDVLIAIARHHDDYAYTGLLDPEREKENRKKALEIYSNYLKIKKDDISATIALGRIFLREGNVKKAFDLLDKAVKRGAVSQNILLWYMECLYRLERFNELRSFTSKHFKDVADKKECPWNIVDALKLWAGSKS